MAQEAYLEQRPLERRASEIAAHQKSLRLDNDRDLSRMGGWLLASGAFATVTGLMVLAAGILPGLMAVGAGLALGTLGVLTLGLVAHHQG